MKLSPIAYEGEVYAYHFICPGCKDTHTIPFKPHPNPEYRGSAVWGFNNDVNSPTFTPSLLVRSGHYAYHSSGDHSSCWCTYNKEHADDPAPFTCYICHSFIRDGNIQFLSDCTHHLAGKTVPLDEINLEDSK